MAYQVILEPGIGQFREFEPRRVHTIINSLGLVLVRKWTCGKRESVSYLSAGGWWGEKRGRKGRQTAAS